MYIGNLYAKQEKQAAKRLMHSMLEGALLNRVRADPGIKRELFAKCLYLVRNSPEYRMLHVIEKAQLEAVNQKNPWRRRLRYTQIADVASRKYEAMVKQRIAAAEAGVKIPPRPGDYFDPGCFMFALEEYCKRHKNVTPRHFDRWLWKRCGVLRDRRKRYVTFAERVLQAHRAFPTVDARWLTLMLNSHLLRIGMRQEMIDDSLLTGDWQ